MVVKRSGLGRNLSALLSQSELQTAPEEKLTSQLKLSVSSLQPGKYQPRGGLDDAALLELTESIKKQGLLQPLVVREISTGRYEIIAGERRWRACQLAGMTEVPVVLRQVDDETAMIMALIENLQRENLNPMDEARAMHRLTTEFALTHQQVADVLCKSRTAVSNALRLLNLCVEVRRMVEQGNLDMGHARALLMLEEHEQRSVADWIVTRKLSVRETEAFVARMKTGTTASPKRAIPAEPLFDGVLQTLADQLQTKVSLKQSKTGKGALIIHYDDQHALKHMIGQLIN